MQFRRLAAAAALSGALLAPAAATAQSLFSTRGLGLPIHPTDARARGLGGVGLGMQGAELGWMNPADVVGLAAPGLALSYQHDDFSASFDGREHDGGTARFPLVLGAFPIGRRAAVLIGAAGFLDQNWAVERTDTLVVDGDSISVLDRFTSEGGVTQLRIGGGYRVLDQLVLGAAFDYYLGSVQRSGGRIFPGESQPGCCRSEWRYSGTGGSVGLEWRPSGALTVATAATFGGTLEADSDDAGATDTAYDIPTRLGVGASGRVSNNLLVALSGEWSGWGTMDETLAEEGGARDVISLHGGLEWDGATLFGRTLPIRLGGRRAELPFGWGTPEAPSGWADETAITSGLGVILGNGAVRADIAGERGSRGGSEAGIEESFWRTTLSVTVLGR